MKIKQVSINSIYQYKQSKTMDALDKIKEILGMVEVVSEQAPTPTELSEAKEHMKFEDAQLEDGTIISAESFEVGANVFILIEDEKQALPIGEYALADGKLLVVEEEGIIASIGEIPEAEEEVVEEVTEELSDSNTQTKDALVQAIGVLENLVQEFASIKEDFKKLKTEANENKAKVEEFEKPGKEINPTPEGFGKATTEVDFFKLSSQERVSYLINKQKS